MPIPLIQTSSLSEFFAETDPPEANSDSSPAETNMEESADAVPMLLEEADDEPMDIESIDTISEEEGMLAVIEGFVSVFPMPTPEQAEHLAQAFLLEGPSAEAFVAALMSTAYGEEDSDLAEVDASAEDEDPEEDDDDEDGLVRALAAGADGTNQDALTEALNNDGVEDHGEAPDDENIQNDGEPDLPSKRPETPEGFDDGTPLTDNSHPSQSLGAEDGTPN